MKFSPYFILRYLFLLILGVFAFDFIYFIFTPLTSLPSFFLISIAYPDAVLNNINIIGVLGDSIVLIEACIAGAAYYFLLILNLTTPMALKTRIKSLFFLIFGIYTADSTDNYQHTKRRSANKTHRVNDKS